jgi:hypothetical protein
LTVLQSVKLLDSIIKYISKNSGIGKKQGGGIILEVPKGRAQAFARKEDRVMKKETMIILAALALILSGCAKESSNGPGGSSPIIAPPGPWVPPTPGPGLNPGLNWQYGATSELKVTNQSMSFYAAYAVNNPTDVKINVNLERFNPASGTNRYSYGGVVSISFRDRGKLYEDQFTSLIYGPGLVGTNEENNKYNVWINKNGKVAWHGFFQDRKGSIVLVFDDSNDLGDGQGPTTVSGSVWVMNFGLTYAPVSPTSCWFVSVGPYDCRTWKSGSGVNTDKDIYPYLENSSSSADKPKAVGYRKVGDFYDMDFKKAFNGSPYGR